MNNREMTMDQLKRSVRGYRRLQQEFALCDWDDERRGELLWEIHSMEGEIEELASELGLHVVRGGA